MEYNAIVVLIMIIRRSEIGGRERRESLKYRMMRRMVRIRIIIIWKRKWS